jgi:hypothetical protein
MSELELREEPEGGGAVAKRAPSGSVVMIVPTAVMCALVLAPASVLGTALLASGSLWLMWLFARDLPSILEQDRVRPEVLVVGSVAASLYMFEMVLDHAVLPLALDALADPLMAMAVGGLALLAVAIPTLAVSVWRFWQREML